MTIFTFETILVLIDGPIHARINNIINTMLVAKAYNVEYKLIWKKDENFTFEWYDIFQEICFEDNIVDSIDIVQDTNYYYNPDVSVDRILNSCVANGLEDNFKERDIIHLQWIVVDNLNGKSVRMISENVLTDDEYDAHIKEMNKSLLYGIQVEGYVNLFYNIQSEQEMVCIYINKGDLLEEYFNYTDNITPQLFIVFHWDFTIEERTKMEKKLKERYEGKCMFVIHETHSKVIEYLCLNHCKLIITLNAINDYLKENKNVVHTIKDNTTRNINITNLQKLVL